MLFSTARWHRAGVHFHPLFQLQLMGLNGAFLTGDLFNLFVFFEVMLAASYGLLLHGSGRARVHAGLHYIAVNLLASSLFLIGVAVIYGVTGTLNMADLARKLPQVPEADRGLLHAGAAILAVAFLAKAAMWPLNFWLPPRLRGGQRAGGRAVRDHDQGRRLRGAAAVDAVLSRVGRRVGAVRRRRAAMGGLATLAFGAIGMLASQHPGRLAGFSLIVSSGTLLAAIGFGQPALTGGALYYLFSSTLALSALFLLVELIERSRDVEVDPPLADADGDVLPFFTEAFEAEPGTNLDDQEEALIGRAIPAALAFLGLSFIAAPRSSSAACRRCRVSSASSRMLSAVLNPLGLGERGRRRRRPRPGRLVALLIGSGLLSPIALSRAGIRHFWAPQQRPPPRLRVVECLADRRAAAGLHAARRARRAA